MDSIENSIFFSQCILLGPASLPAVSPVTNQELEKKRIDFETWLETDAEVSVVHLVFVYVSMQQTKVTGNGEKEIIVPRGQIRELIFKQLRHFRCACTRLSNFCLYRFWQYLGGQVTQPSLEHGADNVDIIKTLLIEKINVSFWKTISNKSLD